MRGALAAGLRAAADLLSPPPPLPSPRVELTVTRSRRKVIDGLELHWDTLDHEPLSPPLEAQTMGLYDTLDLSHDVNGWTKDGQTCVVSHVYHVTWREVLP